MLANIEPALPSCCTGFAVAGALFFSIVSKNLGLVVCVTVLVVDNELVVKKFNALYTLIIPF
ncbi:hypothetical protein [Rufibacter hautae]|uniref:hypothetical protein n=1 Tax=Rufibacter hautae TaxID=2595005 RepID=UPI0016812704|nr:hypothetical protein [Rufibacter hautae]